MSDNTETESKQRYDQVQLVLNEIRPYLQGDGGDCELIAVDEDGTVHIRFAGACTGCPSSSATIKMGIENFLREKQPWVKEVLQAF